MDEYKTVTLMVQTNDLELIKASCESLEGVKFLGWHEERWEGMSQAIIEYKYDHNMYHLGELMGKNKDYVID